METSATTKAVLHDVPPYLKVYEDGTVERFIGVESVPPTLDSDTGVSSKDVIIIPETGVSARIYRPKPTANHHKKHPLVVYFHGGAFCISSTADPKYHDMLSKLVKEAQVFLVSVDYRLAPESPLPAAYEDSWAALQWVASHLEEHGSEDWLKESADFEKVYLAGDSAGANISHHLAIKAGLPSHNQSRGRFKIAGILLVHPYFWGKDPIGVEKENPFFKSVVDKWWEFVCPSDLGCDDPLINPFVIGAPSVEGLASGKILVCVAGNDILRERGRLYYDSLVKSAWKGQAWFLQTEGEDHVFHVIDSGSEKAMELIKKCAQFFNKD
ncbi:putative carboxylesterase 2 [Dorcoceras hygrometricum]|uniref:Putative carboxylesterase 2 n=1 Tax=Dorcoceras hygrometricum TaxID=472368 RepID=A0A2Z7CET9_9LAMI|nr:putative carboxylesterase 2 [Dorcoceras hygrometricum]